VPSGILLTGKRFGHLLVGRELRCDVYRCECKCGTKLTVWRSSLTKGVLRNCGCTWSRRGRLSPYFGHRRFYIGRDKRRHQKTTGELLSWMAAKLRCRTASSTCFELYGGRGIQICERWLEPEGRGFANFLHDLHVRPVGMTLDRINPNGHYEPSNCRWATKDVQNSNQRRFRWPGGEGEPPVVPMEIDEDPALAVCG
jgi:hypothetical protein